MSFLIRGARHDDIEDLLTLSRQFSLLNLPADRKSIEDKIELSENSFKGGEPKDSAKYIFVLEDTEQRSVVGSSQVVAKHGVPGEPSYSFQVMKKERFSKDLGVGFIHQILRLKINENGPTEIGGLVVDRNYRSRPEKVGKLTSLSRFLYVGMNLDKFEDILYSQMAPPLTEEGRSEFWEALGRRFTGMPYQEADLLSQRNKEFIRSLFPEEDIYLCLLDAKARLVMGRVSQETQPALHLLESIGFSYMNEVDPFDGGPHLNVKTKDVSIIKQGQYIEFANNMESNHFADPAMIAIQRENLFLATSTLYSLKEGRIFLPNKTQRLMEISSGEKVYLAPLIFGKSKKGKL